MNELEIIYILVGAYLLIFAAREFIGTRRRYGNAVFFGIFGLLMSCGSFIPPFLSGCLVVVLALIPGLKLMTGKNNGVAPQPQSMQQERYAQKCFDAAHFGNALFLPILIIPLGVLLSAVFTSRSPLVGLSVASVTALGGALFLTRDNFRQVLESGSRTFNELSWTIVISQFLATIGLLFNEAGLDKAIAEFVSFFGSGDHRLQAVVLYCSSMMFFSFILGNAFAAFAIVTTGVGIPLLVHGHGADAAIVGVLGMLSGYSGSIISPLAGNFTIVPTRLLQINDKFGIAKAELPIVLIVLLCHISVMYFTAFP